MTPKDRPLAGGGHDGTHRRPEGCDDATVAASGKLSEALEWVERLRGRLYDFHQMMGRADFLFGDAADALETAGWPDEARWLRTDVVGRNVLDGRWTFQIVEEFDDCYYGPIRAVEQRIHHRVIGGRRHVFEAELKEQRRTPHHRAHTSRPEIQKDPVRRPRWPQPGSDSAIPPGSIP